MIWLVVELILQVNKNYFAGGPSVHKNEEIMEQKPPHFQKALVFVYFRICVFVYLCVSHLIHGNVIFNIFKSYAFSKI